MLTGDDGKAIGEFSYRSYGSSAERTGMQNTPLGYAGQYTSAESGLQYLRARTYDPVTGQFLTPDPLFDFTRQLYSYASNNPLNRIDPSGLCALGPFCNLNPCAGPVAGPLCEVGRKVRNAGAGIVDELGSPLPDEFPGPEVNLGPWVRDKSGIFDDADECSEEYRTARQITSVTQTVRNGKKFIDALDKIWKDGLPDLSSPLPDWPDLWQP